MRQIHEVLALLSLVAGVHAAEPPAERVYSVCEVVDHSGRLVGQTITVRGFLDGSFVNQGLTRDPCPGWRSRYFTSPSAIILSLGGKTESPEAVALWRCIVLFREGGYTPLQAEITGTLVKKSPFPVIFRRPNGSYYSLFGSGFGPQGSGYPLQLMVKGAKCPN